MATITLRNVKGSPLTNAEVDSNFTNLNNELSNLGANPIFTGDVVISGDLTVQGNTTTIAAQNLSISDNMIYMNQDSLVTITDAVGDGFSVVYTTEENNYIVGMSVSITGITPSSFNATDATITAVTSTSFTISSSNTDTYTSGGEGRAKSSVNPDLGWAGGYNDGSYAHAGLFRDASDGKFKVYDSYTPEPDADTSINTSHASFNLANFQAGSFYGDGANITNVDASSVGGSSIEEIEGNALALAIALG